MLLLLIAFQQAPDTITRPPVLPTVEVTVTRRTTLRERLPAAVHVIQGAEASRGRLGLGLDEALAGLAGVHVSNRANFSLDQRFSIRGFGSRANFGLRGVKVVLDGVPQTLPDGQSQLSNVDYSTLERIEIYRGAAGALYGNASGGVLNLTTRSAPDAGLTQTARATGGSFGTFKWDTWTGLREGPVAATLALSRFTTDGFRDHSDARGFQANVGVDLTIAPTWLLSARMRAANAPRARNPGAINRSEVEIDPRTAAPNNLLRGADKRVDQQQVSLTLRQIHARSEAGLTIFGLWRDLDNPLATPPPGPPSAAAGTFNRIDRTAGGARAWAAFPLGEVGLPVLVTGVDLQFMRDNRENERADAGTPTGQVFADQRERITELGPFARIEWTRGRVTVTGGVRWDRIDFDVQDRVLADGDGSGGQTLSALSGHVGASLAVSTALVPWVALSTAFESPTSTELAVRSGGMVGFNEDLDPQRAIGIELGVRGHRARTSWDLVIFHTSIRDALVQQQEQDGRALFANAGRTRQRGVELALAASPTTELEVSGAWTWADYTFRRYRIQNGAAVDTLDGNRLPATPEHQVRLGVRYTHGGWAAALDQRFTSSLLADDRNTLSADGAAVTDMRVSWGGTTGQSLIRPFTGVSNLFDKSYIGSVTINGFGGRVFEPSPGRTWFVGLEVGFGGCGC